MVLPENVPQGDVDCAQRRHDCRAAEMGPAIHVLPVVLDEARVLADQILGEGRNRAGGRIMEGPGTGFPETDEIIVRGDLDEEKPVHEDGLDLGNTHRCRSEEHTSELQSLMRISYAVFCLKKKKNNKN